MIIADVPVHVIQRGVDRAACFFTDDDRQVYLDALAGVARAKAVAVHAYVLMTNHVHLLVTTSASDCLSSLMKGLGQRYLQYVNRTYRWAGTLQEGRFRSCLVEAEAYFLACQCYVELTPVRAAVMSGPADYRWSSFAANSGAYRDAIRESTNSGFGLGSDRFQRQVAAMLGRRTW